MKFILYKDIITGNVAVLRPFDQTEDMELLGIRDVPYGIPFVIVESDAEPETSSIDFGNPDGYGESIRHEEGVTPYSPPEPIDIPVGEVDRFVAEYPNIAWVVLEQAGL